MINPNENNFTQQDPQAALPPRSEPEFGEEAGDLGGAPTFPSSSSADTWAQRREKLNDARKRTQLFLRENPIPSLLGALGLGVALGWALRHATIGEEKEEEKTPLSNINWSFLSLPFLWPFFRSVKERYEDSAESLKDGVDRLKKIDLGDYAKPIRKRWKAWRD